MASKTKTQPVNKNKNDDPLVNVKQHENHTACEIVKHIEEVPLIDNFQDSHSSLCSSDCASQNTDDGDSQYQDIEILEDSFILGSQGSNVPIQGEEKKENFDKNKAETSTDAPQDDKIGPIGVPIHNQDPSKFALQIQTSNESVNKVTKDHLEEEKIMERQDKSKENEEADGSGNKVLRQKEVRMKQEKLYELLVRQIISKMVKQLFKRFEQELIEQVSYEGQDLEDQEDEQFKLKFKMVWASVSKLREYQEPTYDAIVVLIFTNKGQDIKNDTNDTLNGNIKVQNQSNSRSETSIFLQNVNLSSFLESSNFNDVFMRIMRLIIRLTEDQDSKIQIKKVLKEYIQNYCLEQSVKVSQTVCICPPIHQIKIEGSLYQKLMTCRQKMSFVYISPQEISTQGLMNLETLRKISTLIELLKPNSLFLCDEHNKLIRKKNYKKN